MKSKVIFLNANKKAGDAKPGMDAAVPKAAGLPENPFVGLRPFRSSEDQLFFGRYEQAADLLQMLHETRFLSVIGSSGCGKSSLIYAGLIPKLRAGFLASERHRWHVVTMRPGDAPMRNLAAALLKEFPNGAGGEEKERSVETLAAELRGSGFPALMRFLSPRVEQGGGNLFLLVDQFEEIFRFGSYSRDGEAAQEEGEDQRYERRAEAAYFVSAMLELSRREELHSFVAMTMRSDFVGDCDAFDGLPEAMNGSQYLVPRLTRRQKQEAIEGPIRLYGATASQRFVDRVLNDTGEESDQLPVMQHALMRTWEKWAETRVGPVDLAHYEHEGVGTIKNALSLDAKRAIDSMGVVTEEEDATTPLAEEGEGEPPSKAPKMTKQQIIAKRMLQALTQTDAKGRRLRRPARVGDIAEITDSEPEEVLAVADRFIEDNRSFLFISDAPEAEDRVIDISHESLIRKWGKLRKWVDEEARSRDHYLRLSGDAERHAAGDSDLLTGTALQVALNWWNQRQPTEPWARRYHKRVADDDEFARKSKEEFERTDKFLHESERVRTEDAAARETARQNELKQAKQLARQRKTTTVIFLVAFIIASILLAATIYAQRRAAASESIALSAQKALKEERDHLKDKTKELDEANVKLTGRTEELEGNKKELEGNKKELEKKNKELEAEKIKQQQAYAALQKTANDLADSIKKGETLKLRGDGYIAYNSGLKTERHADRTEDEARKLQDLRQASASYDAAIKKFQKLPEVDDKLTDADIEAALGKLMFRDEFKLEGSDGGPQGAASPTPDAQSASAIGRSIANVVLASAAPMPGDFALIDMSREKMEGMRHFGAAVAAYRTLSGVHPVLAGDSATLLEESGELLDASDAGNVRSGFKEVPSDVAPDDTPALARRQAAINLFCAASADIETATQEALKKNRASLLLKVGYRLAPLETSDKKGAAVGKSRLTGCDKMGTDPNNYFDAALKIYKDLIDKEGRNAESVAGLRDEGVDAALRLGKFYLNRGDDEGAGKYFEGSLKFYAGENPDDKSIENLPPDQLKKLMLLLTEIANIYLNKDEVVNIVPNMDKAGDYLEAVAMFSKPLSAEARAEIATEVTQSFVWAGETALTNKDTEAADALFGFVETFYDVRAPKQRDELSSRLIDIGQLYFNNNMPDAARDKFEKAVNLYGARSTPDERDAFSKRLVRIGAIYMEHEQSDVATAYYNRSANVYVNVNEPEKAAEVYEEIGDALPSEEGRDVEFYSLAAREYAKAKASAADDDARATLTDKQVNTLRKAARSVRAVNKSGQIKDALRNILFQSYQGVLTLYPDMSSTDEKVKALKDVAEGYVEMSSPDDAVRTYKEALKLLAPDDARRKGDIFLGIGKAEQSRGSSGFPAAEEAYNTAKKAYQDANSNYNVSKVDEALKSLSEPGPTRAVTPKPTPTPQRQSAGISLKARLRSGGEGAGLPKGKAKFNVDDEDATDREFEVSVEQVNLPADTVLDVWVDGLRVGAIKLRGEGKHSTLTLRSKDEETVPQVSPYSHIVIKDPDGNVIVFGSFGGPRDASPQTH